MYELLSTAKNLPELNIRIFQSAYFLLLIYRYVPLCCRRFIVKKAFGFNSFNYSNFFNSLINNS